MVIHHVTRATRHLLFWSLIATALALSAVRIFLADVADYKQELEQKIRETTHIPIRIGRLSTNMRGFSPGIVLENISVDGADAKAKPAIRLKEIRLGIDLLQLLWTRDALSSSWVTLVGAKIDVIRDLDGKLVIKGLQSSDEQPLWLLQGSKYELLQSDVSWQDLKNNGKRVHFNNLDLLLKNHYFGRSHEIHLLTTLPEQYGETLRISALIEGNVFEPDNLEGQLYVEAVNLQGPALANGDLPQGLKIDSGSGDVRLWSEWRHSTPYRIAGYIQAQQLQIGNQQGKTLRLDTFSGNVSWLEQDGNWRLGAYDVDIVADCQGWRNDSRDGGGRATPGAVAECSEGAGTLATFRRHWPDGEFYLQQGNQGNWSGLIKHMHLQALAYIAPLFIPADHEYGDWPELNPTGILNDFALYAQGDWQHYALSGHFSQLGNAAVNALPRLQGLTGHISGTDSGGQIEFYSENALFDAPDLFRNTLAVKRLTGRMDWHQETENWRVISRGLTLDTPDFETETDFDLILPKDKTAANLDLNTRFGHFADMSKVPGYLPAKVMGNDAVDWLDHAFFGGQITQGELTIRGNLDQFPFTNGQGRFETLFSVENGDLQFNADWPHLRELTADVQFLGEDLKVAISDGRSENIGIDQAVVTITNLANSDHVEVKGRVQGSVQNALSYLQKTPLHPHVDDLPKILASDSNTHVDLDLNIPYYETKPVRARVDAHLHDARLTLKPVDLAVDKINGILHFTEDRISSEPLTGATLGFPIKALLGSDDSATRLRIEGATSVANLEKQFSFLQNDIADGNFSYRAELTLPYAASQPTTLSISSNLQGVSISGEDALGKTADEQRALRLDFQFDDQPLVPMQLSYGAELNAALLIDNAQSRLFSSHIVLGGGPANTPRQAGLKVEIRQPSFKLSQAVGALSATEGRGPALREILLDTDQLIWQGHNLGAIRCHFQHGNQAWQGTIDSAMAKGSLSIPDQRSGKEPIKLDMDYLNLTAMSELNFDAAEEAVTVLPLIDIDSRQLLWRSVDLGKLKLQTDRLNSGVHFKKIKLGGADKNIDFTADWIKQPNGSSTLINGSLSTDDFGSFLAKLGISDDFKETHADISFTGGWSGAPHQFSLAQLNGQLQVKLSDGRISSIEPGFGRLLGLIAMEQWAKRLSLDFSDIYRQGLAFDKIFGNFRLTNGVAYTDDLLIDAVSAKMKIVGTANLVDKILDHRVAVIPKSSGAVPIAGTIVGGIVAIITEVVTNNYQEGYFFGSEYKVAGPWGNVEVTPVHDQGGLLNKTWHGLTDFGWLE
ncbi:MAG: TIGR02099 family protein [Methylococcaceae bacterium]|nr:TIGR02099 family protein [Methylococcaceae bacterium]